jgi:DNA-binding MarR family transcriptional regulator
MKAKPRRRPGTLARSARIEAAERLHSAMIHLLRSLRRRDPSMGLTPSRASALSVIVFGGPVTLSRLASLEQVSAPTMTRLVSGLEAGGYARRRPDPDDRRSVLIEATPRGLRTLREGRKRRVADLARRLGSLPRERVGALRSAAIWMEDLAAAASTRAGTPARESRRGAARAS